MDLQLLIRMSLQSTKSSEETHHTHLMDMTEKLWFKRATHKKILTKLVLKLTSMISLINQESLNLNHGLEDNLLIHQMDMQELNLISKLKIMV